MTREQFLARTERFTTNKDVHLDSRVAAFNFFGVADFLRKHWPEITVFRGLQTEAINAQLHAQDSLAIMPTGGGKSLCYQLPAVLSPSPPGRGQGEGQSLTIVISPLIALMKDQVDSLTRRGIKAASLHSGQLRHEQKNVLEGASRGLFSLLYVSPERCLQPEFLTFLTSIADKRIRAFVIDESHCISQWGHEFRPDYAKLGFLRRIFPVVPIHAYTATATQRVRLEICDVLGLRDPLILVGDFDRPNLFLSVVKREPPVDFFTVQLLPLVRESLLAPGATIIYCPTRMGVDSLVESLRANDIDCLRYHAGMDDAERIAVQDAFMRQSTIGNRQSPIVAATLAFGMGIDRPDVRQVIHTAMPQSLEQYHQEIGRSGRDGRPARCTLLYDHDDYERLNALIVDDDSDAEFSKIGALYNMMMFCEEGITLRGSVASCLRRFLLAHFDQPYEPENCGACNVCDTGND